MTQTRAILNHLQEGHVLTPLQALQYFGVFRLSARILELRKAGWNIVAHRKRIGTKTIAMYQLLDRVNHAE